MLDTTTTNQTITILKDGLEPPGPFTVSEGDQVTFQVHERSGESTRVTVKGENGEPSDELFGESSRFLDVRHGNTLIRTVRPHSDKTDYTIEVDRQESGDGGPINGSIKVVKKW